MWEKNTPDVRGQPDMNLPLTPATEKAGHNRALRGRELESSSYTTRPKGGNSAVCL